MSTIVCAGDGIVAADSQNNREGSRIPNPTPKLVKTKSGVYGVTGMNMYLQPMIKWYESGCAEENYPSTQDDDKFNFIVFLPTHCEVYLANCLYPDTYNYPCAFGSGADFAIAAVSMGANSIRAVEVACEHDTQSGLPVRSFPLKKPSVVRSTKDAKQTGQGNDVSNNEAEGKV